eukprot:TRINITY_DN55300_c0_g1_i1.p2 TRINITY_DN55300_c0_g1~~TRINITY_DN55300_c0_g1_i1.p2  ORF type:complete len:107 (+),score=30.81 TRINITY_DN55300_c0_g1_i1:71-391(+)
MAGAGDTDYSAFYSDCQLGLGSTGGAEHPGNKVHEVDEAAVNNRRKWHERGCPTLVRGFDRRWYPYADIWRFLIRKGWDDARITRYIRKYTAKPEDIWSIVPVGGW